MAMAEIEAVAAALEARGVTIGPIER